MLPSIPALSSVVPREEWPDADFDFPDGDPIHSLSARDDTDEDWDLEMDFGQTGGAKATPAVTGMSISRSPIVKTTLPSSSSTIGMITIRPPLHSLGDADDDDDEGVSTIKAEGISTLKAVKLGPKIPKSALQETIEEDFEDGFILPSDLTKLSLAPVSLSHRASKHSLEWGEKDNSASSSHSSDTYSTLGFADNYPSSTSSASASLPELETDDDEDELDGVVIPPALFESRQSGRQLNKILESKKKADPAKPSVKHAVEDDFEAGLVIEDDIDLSPSRLLSNNKKHLNRSTRSNSNPPPKSSTLRPPSRAAKLDRSKSPTHPPPSSTRQLQKIRMSPSPPLMPSSRSQYQPFAAAPPIPSPVRSPTSGFLTPKPGSLRAQKSHSGLKPPTPPATARQLNRKASLSVIESTSKQASRASLEVPGQSSSKTRYDEPTAASKAKSHVGSTSRMSDFKVPPTRPCTPSANTAALRLTMPTQSRLKLRPALSQVFGPPPEAKTPVARAPSPLPPPPPRPPSNMSLRASARASKASSSVPPLPTAAPKLLRKPKRIRTFGDGTELDAIDDLPLDHDKEGRFRVQPKGTGNRIPGGTWEKDRVGLYTSGEKAPLDNKGTLRRNKREATGGHEPLPAPFTSATNTLRRTGTRIDISSKPPPAVEQLPKRRKGTPGNTRRKPTLIRNLGGAGGTKVVGDMKWNPSTMRWEGNDSVLREFDAAITSTRPALITQLSGSVMGSPSGSLANGARVVGNMYFDPNEMRWISTLPPEEDEPDVFAHLADDEEDNGAWERRGDTIRAAQSARVSSTSTGISKAPSSDAYSIRSQTSSPTNSHSLILSDSESDRGSRASMLVADVDEAFVQQCREAEARHRTDMRGWKTALTKYDPYHGPDRTHLYEIRALATRKY